MSQYLPKEMQKKKTQKTKLNSSKQIAHLYSIYTKYKSLQWKCLLLNCNVNLTLLLYDKDSEMTM